MSLHYILDGYNIIKQIPSLKLNKLKNGRDSLIRFIEEYHPQGSPNNKVTIVFDGDKDVLSHRHSYPFDVFFSKGESADDRIRKIVQGSRNPKNIIVVTDDRELKFLIRSLRAQTISVQEFLGKAKRDTSRSKKESEKRISISAREEITQELRRIWLKQ